MPLGKFATAQTNPSLFASCSPLVHALIDFLCTCLTHPASLYGRCLPTINTDSGLAPGLFGRVHGLYTG